MFKGEKALIYLVLLIALAISVSATYTPDQYTVALWHFDECSGNTAYDSTVNGNTGALNNVEWTTDSISGCAVKFNGLNSIINAGNLDDYPHDQTTIEAWVKRNSHTPGTVISRNGPYYLAINPDIISNRFPIEGTIRAGVYTGTWHEFSSNTVLRINQWYHIAMTYDGSNLKIFVNGTEDSSFPVTGQVVHTGQNFHVGWGDPGQNLYFDGLIDEVRISNTSRTSFDVSTTTTTVSTTTTSTIVTTIPVYSRNEVDTLLAERDARIDALESRVSLLETALSNVRNTLTAIQNTVSNLFTSLFGLPKGLRQEMVCSAMKATNQTSVSGFGLTCSLNDKGACSCS